MGWFIANVALGVVAGVAGIASIFTGIKAAPYEQQLRDKEISKKSNKK